MKTCTWSFCAALVALMPLATSGGEVKPDNEAAVRQIGESYVDAFNRRDAKALAAHWSPEAVYTNRVTGEQVVGREAIEAQFVALFKAQPELKIDVGVESIQFLSPNVAVEHGAARFLVPEQEPESVNYTAVYVRREGKWLLDRVTDLEPDLAPPPSHYEQLKALEWMIGRWADDDENVHIETECNWTRNKNFITRSFTMSIGDRVDMAGMQIIGWDPAAGEIRSWTFDSDGGFAQGRWTHKGDRWYIHKSAVLPDGRKSTAVNIVKHLDENTLTLQSVSRTLDGDLLPNIDEVKVVRAAAATQPAVE